MLGEFKDPTHPEDNLFAFDISPQNELYTLDINYNSGSYSIDKRIGNDSIDVIYKSREHFPPLAFYKLLGQNHWITNEDQIIRVSFDGKEIEKYATPNHGVINYVYSDSAHIFFMDKKSECIYTWNEKTDKLELYQQLPPQLKGIIL